MLFGLFLGVNFLPHSTAALYQDLELLYLSRPCFFCHICLYVFVTDIAALHVTPRDWRLRGSALSTILALGWLMSLCPRVDRLARELPAPGRPSTHPALPWLGHLTGCRGSSSSGCLLCEIREQEKWTVVFREAVRERDYEESYGEITLEEGRGVMDERTRLFRRFYLQVLIVFMIKGPYPRWAASTLGGSLWAPLCK